MKRLINKINPALKLNKVKILKNRFKFYTFLMILLIFGVLFTSFISYFSARKSLSSQLKKSILPLTSDNIYSEIRNDLLKPIFISSMMANNTFVKNWVLKGEKDESLIIEYLKEIHQKYKTITSFFVSDKTKKYYHFSGVIKKVNINDSQDRWFFRLKKLKQDYEINIDKDTTDRTSLRVFINHKILDYNSKFLGAIGVGLDLKQVKKRIENYKKKYKREIYFINKSGIITLHGLSYNGVNNVNNKNEAQSFFSKVFKSKNTVSFSYYKNNTLHFINSRYIPELNWYLIVEQARISENNPIKKTLILNLSIGLIISIVIFLLAKLIISEYQKRLEKMALTDKLTGSANRQVFEIIYKQVQSRAKRNKTEITAILFDIDNFKNVNDNFGHLAGDFVLKRISREIKNNIRGSDTLFRWGGEEFLILLSEANLTITEKIANKIRIEIQNLELNYQNKKIKITISGGVSTIKHNENIEKLLKQCDEALYIAKEKGRNLIIVYKE